MKTFLFILCCLGTFNFFAETISFPGEAPGKITFIGNAGSDNIFTVNQWKFTRVENLDQIENIGISAILDMTSITTDWKDLEQSLHKKKDYFHSKKWKTATITIDGAQAQEDGSYVAEATVQIKKFEKAVPITFTLEGDETTGYTVMATTELKRQKWGFTGGGPKDIVPVTIEADLVISEQ